MVKRVYFPLLLLIGLLTFPRAANAALVEIQENGDVVVNVLSLKDAIDLDVPEIDYVEIESVVGEDSTEIESKVTLSKIDGRAKLSISSESGDKTLEVSNYEEDLIEIVGRPKTEKLLISYSGERFVIKQNNIKVETEHEISIDPESAEMTLKTPSGSQYLSILPGQAVDIVLRSKTLTKVSADLTIRLKEMAGNKLAYEIAGDKIVNLFNIYKYAVPVKAQVSASTGEILSIDQPTWLKVVSFLFV